MLGIKDTEPCGTMANKVKKHCPLSVWSLAHPWTRIIVKCMLSEFHSKKDYPNCWLIPMGDTTVLPWNQPTKTHLQRVGLLLEQFVSTICSLQFTLVNLLVHTSGRDLRHGFVIRFRGLMNY